MSQENLEIVRRVFNSINRGDIDGALENAAEDFEVDWSNSIGPAKGIYSGKDQVREYWTFSYGKARSLKLFQSKAEALEALGLSE